MQSTAFAAVADYPVLDVIGDRFVDENSLLSFTLSADDSENDTLTFTCPDIDSIAGATLDPSSGLFEWTPTYEQADEYLVQFVVSDGSNIDSEYITITVKNTNRAPVFSVIPDSSTNENEEIQLTLDTTDEDSDILAFSKDVSFGTLDGNVFTWTPDYDDQGEHEIVFSVTDGSSTVTQSALINVSNVNRGTILYSISDVSVPENTPVTIQLNGFDADGDELGYSSSSLPSGSTFDSDTGLFQWSNPTSGTYDLTFRVTDSYASDTKYPQIVVGATSEHPPNLNSIDSKSINEGSEVSFDITALDDDNDKIDISLVSPPSGSYLIGSGSSVSFVWIPGYEQAGSYKVEFKVSETNTKYRFATYQVVDIIVNDVNRAPVINTVADYIVAENDILYVDLSATDLDGDTLTYSTDSSLGIVRGNTFICTPDYNDEGVYDVLYTVSDGSLKNSATATITVTDSNMPPKINSISPMEVAINNTLDFSLSVSDEDVSDTFSYKALDLPSNASFDESSGSFEWTPSSDDIGDYSVSFYVSDSSHEDYETVSITVTETSSSSSSTTSSSSSGGGGGGGSMTTGEPYKNVAFKDYVLRPVIRDTETVFSFNKDENSITSISFTSMRNAGQIKAMVEMLKGTSSLVDGEAPGTVYRNLNIWVGDSKFSSDTLSDIIIKFKIESSWFDPDDHDPELIELYRYHDGSWNPLETSLTGEDDEYFYYEAETSGFSSFAILVPPEIKEISMAEEDSTIDGTMMSLDDEMPEGESVQPASQDSKRSILLLFVIAIIGSFVFLGYRYRFYYDELYKQIANPDGKRYRRIKR
ncbi:PGF-pre-PGF domain-containing protein [Methanolobus sp. WCC4]|uniref:PGF-pre-PGF domain-containing protein n=1 Tax=Methanolobus sp. WCC4 TaxID=3125784 RepID=UPI0030FA962E